MTVVPSLLATTTVQQQQQPPLRRQQQQQRQNNKTTSYFMAGKFLLVLIAVTLLLYEIAWTFYLPGLHVPDTELDLDAGRIKTRRRPDRIYKFNANNEKVETTPFDSVMEGHHTLINIQIPKTGLKRSSEGSDDQLYENVKATFCHISWDLQQQNPAAVPMFKDLQGSSFLCQGTMYTTDLWRIARQAEQYDARNHTFAATVAADTQGSFPPTAVVFHETRCGSTLIANILAAFAPQHTRVYSEAPPPITALSACNNHNNDDEFLCDHAAHIQLIRDVFYLSGRMTRPALPQYVFYKINSVGVQHIAKFVEAMPDTPWMFAYRDSVPVMMSHFKHYYQSNANNILPISKAMAKTKAVCLRNYGKLKQPAVLTELVMAAGNRTVSDLTREEYCAAHLATLAEYAIRQHEQNKHIATGVAPMTTTIISSSNNNFNSKTTNKTAAAAKQPPHWFVNYNELPYFIWETVLPQLIVGVLRHDEISRMHAVAKVYSKSRNDATKKHWQEDDTVKNSKAPPSLKRAVELFLDPVYAKMESIRQEIAQQQQHQH